MKQFIYGILGVAIFIGGGITLSTGRQKQAVVAPAQTRTEPAPSPASTARPPGPPPVAAPGPAQPVPTVNVASPLAVEKPATEAVAKPVDAAIKEAIESLLSAPLTHEQRRAILKQLNAAGKLDQTISELEQLAAANPHTPGYTTALGQADLEKALTLMPTDVAGGSILAMQAVKSFDTALSDDPGNWEARFSRAAILSHYPVELNQGQEVIDQFSQLIDQQEKQPPQAQFANTYVLLGDQYQKLGKNDYAQATWQIGAALFPGDATLQKRLAGQ